MRFITYDRQGVCQGDLDGVLGANLTWGVDGTDTLEITLLGGQSVEKGWRIVFVDSMNRVREYIVTSPQTKRAAGMPMTSLACKGSVVELSQSYIEDKRNRAASVRDALSKALEGTRWTVGDTESDTTADTSFYHTSVLEAVQSLCDTYKLELVASYGLASDGLTVTGRTISLVQAQGRATGVPRRFEYRRDLTDITRTIDASDVVTRLYGYGKGVQSAPADGETMQAGYGRKLDFADVNGGKPYVEDTAATALWGVPGPDGSMQPSCGVFEDGDCDDPAKLLAETKAALQTRSAPQASYTATVLALGQAGMDVDGVDLGDQVQIVDDSFTPRLALEGRVLKLETNLFNPSDTTVTLGNLITTYSQQQAAAQQQLSQLAGSAGAWDDATALRPRYLDSIIDSLNAHLNQSGGYTYLTPGEGIMVYDRPVDDNPTMCIQIGGGYFRIADSKNSDGTWRFRTAGDGHGLYADVLYTGEITDGTSYWDLTHHQLSMVGSFQTKSTDGHSVAGFLPDYDWVGSGSSTVKADGSGIVFQDVGRSVADRRASISYLGWDKTSGTPLNTVRVLTNAYGGYSGLMEVGQGADLDAPTQTSAILGVRSPRGDAGIRFDADTDALSLGGRLSSWPQLNTFRLAYWEGLSINPFTHSKFTVAADSPARAGRYKPLATIDYKTPDADGQWNVFFDTTVSDASASGWTVHVHSCPETIDGKAFFHGTQSFNLNTLGVLI